MGRGLARQDKEQNITLFSLHGVFISPKQIPLTVVVFLCPFHDNIAAKLAGLLKHRFKGKRTSVKTVTLHTSVNK